MGASKLASLHGAVRPIVDRAARLVAGAGVVVAVVAVVGPAHGEVPVSVAEFGPMVVQAIEAAGQAIAGKVKAALVGFGRGRPCVERVDNVVLLRIDRHKGCGAGRRHSRSGSESFFFWRERGIRDNC